MDAELAGNHETPECRVQGAGSRVQGLGSRVQGPGFRVQGVGRSVPRARLARLGPFYEPASFPFAMLSCSVWDDILLAQSLPG